MNGNTQPKLKITIRTIGRPDRDVLVRTRYNQVVRRNTISFHALGLQRPADDFPHTLVLHKEEGESTYRLLRVVGPAYCAWGVYENTVNDTILVTQ